MKEDRRVFCGYDKTLTATGWYNKEFAHYVLTVSNPADLQYHIKGENSTMRVTLGVSDTRGRLSATCIKRDPEFRITIRLNTVGLAGLVRCRGKSKREGLSNQVLVAIRADKDVESVVEHIRKTFESYMEIKGIEKVE